MSCKLWHETHLALLFSPPDKSDPKAKNRDNGFRNQHCMGVKGSE